MDTALDCDGNVFFCNKLDRIYTILPKVGVLYVFNIFHIDLNTFIFELKCTINTLAATTFTGILLSKGISECMLMNKCYYSISLLIAVMMSNS